MGTELAKTIEGESLSPTYPYMPKEEWENRISKARRLMTQKGLDAILILNREDSLYFFGRTKPYKFVFPFLGIIPREGPTTMISENEYADLLDWEGYANRNIGYRGQIPFPFEKAPDPIKVMAEVIEELGLANKTIGMEYGPFMWWEGFTMNEWEQFRKLLPKAKFVDATDLIWEVRMIKSDWEIGIIRHLLRATAKGYLHICLNAGPGKNEKQLFYEAMEIWMDEGIIDSFDYHLNVIGAGGRIGPSSPQNARGKYLTLHSLRDRVLEKGDYVMLDGGPTYKGYCVDIQRMIYIGDPGREIRRLGELAVRGQEAVEDILKPGITAGDIYMAGFTRVAKDLPNIWYNLGSRKTSGWCGHGQGLTMHELPYLCKGSTTVIKEGMVISVEISSVAADKRLVNMPEDLYLITKDGFELLSKEFGPGGIYIQP
jgi:Xaa-Pro aminopeptidase